MHGCANVRNILKEVFCGQGAFITSFVAKGSEICELFLEVDNIKTKEYPDFPGLDTLLF